MPWEEPGASDRAKAWLYRLGAVALALQRCRAAVAAADRRTMATLTKAAASTVVASCASTKSTSAAFEMLVSAAVGLPIGYDARRFSRSEPPKNPEDLGGVRGLGQGVSMAAYFARGATRLQPLGKEEEWKLPRELRWWLMKQRARWREGLLPAWQCNLLRLLGVPFLHFSVARALDVSLSCTRGEQAAAAGAGGRVEASL
jgi:hypothetical protein